MNNNNDTKSKKIKALKPPIEIKKEAKLTTSLIEIKLINKIKNEDQFITIINQHFAYKFS